MMSAPPLDPADLPDKLDRSHELLYVQMVFLIIAGINVLVRVYVKTFIVKHNALDDYLIYAAMIGYIVYGTIAMDGAVNGATGKHYALGYGIDEAVRSLRGWYLCMVLYAPITVTIRASVCVLLLRLTTSKLYRGIIYFNLILIATISIAFFFIMVFQCSPPSYFWTQLLGSSGYCHNKLIVTYSTTVHSSLSAASDWCLGLLPIALLWHVKINRRTKGIVAILLSFGMIAGIALIVRIPYVTKLQPGLEFLYRSIDVAVWSVMEPALGIIAACIATFRPLFKTWGFGWRSTDAYPSGHFQLSNARSNGQAWDRSRGPNGGSQAAGRRQGLNDFDDVSIDSKEDLHVGHTNASRAQTSSGSFDEDPESGVKREPTEHFTTLEFPDATYQKT